MNDDPSNEYKPGSKLYALLIFQERLSCYVISKA